VLPPLPARRAVGLLAAGTIGLSTALLGIPGVAAADPSGWTFTDASPTIVVPTGTCAIDWSIVGSRGGAGIDGISADSPMVTKIRTAVGAGWTFTLAVGAPGASAADGGAGGTNSQGNGAWDGHDAPDTNGGGGGAASVVLRNGTPYLGASGGQGRGPNGGGAPGYNPAPFGPNAPVNADVVPPTSAPPATTYLATGVDQGSITGTGVACGSFPYNPLVPAPGKPTVVPGPQQLYVIFTPTNGPGTVPPGTTWEYSLDGGAWTPTGHLSTTFGDPTQRFSLFGLTDGHDYLVRLRAKNANGVSEAVPAYITATPYTRPGKPTAVTMETRPSALAISWSPPVNPGTYPLTEYSVYVMRADATEDDPGPSWGCSTDADGRGCVIGVPAGDTYVAYVSAIGGELHNAINDGDYEAVTSGVVPLPAIPAAVPHKDADLVGASGPLTSVSAGKTVVLKGTGFAPYSKVRAIAYSTPTELGTYVADENGEFEITVTVPAGLAAGEHTLVVSGVDADGNVRNVLATVTVDGTGTAVVTKATLAKATATGLARTGLPNTGADVGVPLAGGAAALILGGGLITAGRRRTAA
jgi:LPXTG-motif cell wall-anchored protein